MKQVTNEELSNMLVNKDLIRLRDNILRKFAIIDAHDAKSAYDYAVWKAMQNYVPDRGTKFTTYFCSIFFKICVNLYKKEKRQIQIIQRQPVKTINYFHCLDPIEEYLEYVPDEYHDILRQRFSYKMTLMEIAEANGYSHEIARREIADALEFLKEEFLE